MENQNNPLLIRPSRTPKISPKMNFVPSPSLLLMPPHGCVPVLFHVTFQIFCKNLAKPFRNNSNWYELNMESAVHHPLSSFY